MNKQTKLREWRLDAGWSLRDVADLSGFSTAMISRAERGERCFTPASKVRLARSLGVTIGDLFDAEAFEEVSLEEIEGGRRLP